MRELPGLGVEVEPERWWDETQRGDIIHFVNRPSSAIHVTMAKEKGFRTIMTEFLDQPSSRSRRALFLQRRIMQLGRKAMPGLTGRLAWSAYRELDAMAYAAPHEWETAKYLFDATPSRGHVIPHGLPNEALSALREPAEQGDYLISVATIAPRKNSVLLAEAAQLAKTPVVFLGKPYSDNDPYFRAFMQLVDNQFVRYPGFVSEAEKFAHLREARGFVLFSQFESGCVAAYEAAAAGLPLLLPDLPWAVHGYPRCPGIRHVPLGSAPSLAASLRQFYRGAQRANTPTFNVLSWRDVAARYVDIYRAILKP